jgi:hypothetical protein
MIAVDTPRSRCKFPGRLVQYQCASNFNLGAEWLPALGLRQMIDWIKARWTGIICPLLGHKPIPLTQYQDGFFLWACERCGYRDWEFASRKT